ncbi:hypothetical protein MPER_09617, partial [Moniliophthora perniciosa FA553]
TPNSSYDGIENADLLKVTTARLRARKAPTTFQWVKGHDGIEGNEKADQMASEGREKEQSDIIDMNIPPALLITGAKLNKMTQSLAYEAIKQNKRLSKKYKEALDRPRTKANIKRARKASKKLSGEEPSDKQVWKSLRNKTISRNVCNFIFKALHGGHRVGDYWKGIPNYEDRAVCSHCNKTESMRHILFKCKAPGRKEVWTMAQDLWRKKGIKWIKPTYGIVLACGQISLPPDDEGITKAGDSRLYQILVSESVFLIWRLRNERVINDEGPPSVNEITNRWIYTIRHCLKIDILLTNRERYGRQAISNKLVRTTWRGVTTEDGDDLQALDGWRLGF